MEILGKLFGSEAKVKIMRLFLFNPKVAFSVSDIVNRAKIKAPVVRKELLALKKVHMIVPRVAVHLIETKKGDKITIKKKSEDGWMLDSSFPYLSQFQDLLIHTVLLQDDAIVKKINSAGKMKLIIISGVFIRESDSRVDLLVVADKLKPKPLEAVIKNIEAEIGKEIKYSAFETKDFQYRYGMYDKLIRDVLDYPHQTILDKLGLNERVR